MASIVKRKSKYSVVYDYTDENGKRRQRWETFSTNAEAKKRKKQIEYEQDSGTFFIPTAKTLNDLLDEYMSIYGVNTWAMSTYESRRGLARNYITPIIGDMLLSDITPRMMDKYYRDLLSVKTVSVNNRKPTSEYLTPHTVREIHKLLRSAFNQAVRWELISRNPVLNATLPKEEHKERDIWTAETLSKAMEVCDDPILSLALNLAFSCSLRIGEMLGLTWDCIDIAPQSIENGSAYIFVNKELQRVTRGALDDLSDKGVIKKFPPCIASTHTALVLKEPKTKTSIRRVYLPKTVAYMLVERKKEIDELMDLFGDEYIDNNLVFCSSNGRPMESQVINRAFNKLIKENGLPHVVFHSLRHSSITYKLKLNGGDMKSVQGDSGHAQVKMVADVYSHIIDEDRCINAQRLEEAFYSSKTPDPVEDTEPKTADKQRFVGYKFRHMMKVEFLSDNDLLGKVLFALANCPVKPEFRLSYTVSDPEAAKNELLGKAVTDAKDKAAVLTQAAGVTLKGIQSIDYSWGEIDFEYKPMNGMLMADECLAAPMAISGTSYDMDIEPDDIEVSDTVTVLWEIE